MNACERGRDSSGSLPLLNNRHVLRSLLVLPTQPFRTSFCPRVTCTWRSVQRREKRLQWRMHRGSCSFILQLRVPERSVASWLQAYDCAVWLGRGGRNGGNVSGRGGLTACTRSGTSSSRTARARGDVPGCCRAPCGVHGGGEQQRWIGEGCVRDRMLPQWCTAGRADGDEDAHEDEDQQEDGHVRAACRKRRGREEERDFR